MEVINNKQAFRFEIALPDGEYAILSYRWLKGNMVLMHTMVPKAHRGKGIGAMLVKAVLDYIRTQPFRAVIYCPFVAEYLKKHPEYADVLPPTP